MEKLDKVIAGLEACLKSRPRYCFGCPYENAKYCYDEMFTDALELLKTLDQTRMALEVTRMNLGAAREELNRLEGSCDGGDLISRSALLEYGVRVEHGLNEDGILYIPLRDVTRSIENAPAVEAEPVVHARCAFEYLGQIAPGCSRCGMQSIMRYPRCPHCGAVLDGEVSDA